MTLTTADGVSGGRPAGASHEAAQPPRQRGPNAAARRACSLRLRLRLAVPEHVLAVGHEEEADRLGGPQKGLVNNVEAAPLDLDRLATRQAAEGGLGEHGVRLARARVEEGRVRLAARAERGAGGKGAA